MYFDKNNNFPHGIMLHQFHDNKFYKSSEGSISKDDFYDLIRFIGKKNILDANIFFQNKIEGKLNNNDVCLTFDDALKCQIEIALPVLEDLRIKAFFFVSTSMFEKKPDFFYFLININQSFTGHHYQNSI